MREDGEFRYNLVTILEGHILDENAALPRKFSRDSVARRFCRLSKT
jgi:hypothetical protein